MCVYCVVCVCMCQQTKLPSSKGLELIYLSVLLAEALHKRRNKQPYNQYCHIILYDKKKTYDQGQEDQQISKVNVQPLPLQGELALFS